MRNDPTRRAKAGIQLGTMIALAFLFPVSSSAVRVGPPIEYETPAWRLSKDGSLLLEIPFQFVPTGGTGQTPEFLRGARGQNASFLASAWRVAPPDREDHFSVRWLGFWTPGKSECEMRLTADEEATFYVDGMKALTCVEGTTKSEGILPLVSRPQELRVDYSDRSGEAFVRLEWRESGEDWNPVVVATDRKRDSAIGWNADYYLGEKFERKAFSRIDPTVAFDWGPHSPFDRAEDTPTLAWKIANSPDDWTCGEVSPNRDGTLILGLVLAAGEGMRDASLSFTNPLLQFTGAEPGATASLQFDREAANVAIGISTQSAAGPKLSRLEFSLRAGDSIRFWERGGGIANGAQVAKAIAAAELDFQNSRPRFGGAWSRWDEPVILNGAWGLQMLVDRSTSPRADTSAIVGLARLVAPDLLPRLQRPTSDSTDSTATRKGLDVALEGLSVVATKLRENPEGGLDLLFGQDTLEEVRVDRWPLAPHRLDILCETNLFRIADASGTFIAFDSPGSVRGLRVDERESWTGEVELPHPSTLRAGPAERVSEVFWNEAPLLLVREGNRFQARLPSARGRIRLLLLKK